MSSPKFGTDLMGPRVKCAKEGLLPVLNGLSTIPQYNWASDLSFKYEPIKKETGGVKERGITCLAKTVAKLKGSHGARRRESASLFASNFH
jgi:hypothetical protein